MIRRFLLCLPLCFLAAAQTPQEFEGLAATDDGAQFYFSSPLRQRGTDQLPYPKLFRLVSSGFELFEQRDRVYPAPGLANRSNFYRLSAPSVSGDGTVIGYTAELDCVGGSGCAFIERYQSTVLGRGLTTPMVFNGRVQVSGNGRYVLQYGSTGLFPQTAVRDIETGASRDLVQGDRIPGKQSLTSSGSVLVLASAGLVLRSADGDRIISGTDTQAAVINGMATVVIRQDQAGVLFAEHLDTGQESMLGFGFNPVVSADGSLAIYMAVPQGPQSSLPRQVFLINTDGSGRRQLTDVPEGITEATLSGYGNLVYAATAAGRLLRIEVGTGGVEELVPATPIIREITGAPVAGSLNWIRGSLLGDTQQVKLNGREAPLLFTSPGEIVLQIPWEAKLEPQRLELGPSNSPFEPAAGIAALEESRPTFIQFGREIPSPAGTTLYGAVVAHGDFSDIVTMQSPARPGEIVHFYLTGGGAVSPPAVTGEPAPLDRLSRVMPPPDCFFFPGEFRVTATQYFFGLAPGMTGVYQFSTRLPEQISRDDYGSDLANIFLACGEPPYGNDQAAIAVDLTRH